MTETTRSPAPPQGGWSTFQCSLTQALVAMLAPYQSRVYNLCSGSGGTFVLSEKQVVC